MLLGPVQEQTSFFFEGSFRALRDLLGAFLLMLRRLSVSLGSGVRSWWNVFIVMLLVLVLLGADGHACLNRVLSGKGTLAELATYLLAGG